MFITLLVGTKYMCITLLVGTKHIVDAAKTIGYTITFIFQYYRTRILKLSKKVNSLRDASPFIK